jgi:hypothetical protein
MRKIITIGFIIAGVIVSCKKEEITPIKPIVAISKDCNCNRVVKIIEYNLVGIGPRYDCYLINDCTEVQTIKTYSNKPKIGECKK